jgi:CRISPR-associated protein Csm1
MVQQLKRILGQMITESAKLHYALQHDSADTIDSVMINDFLFEWFQNEVAKALKPTLEDVLKFPIKVETIGAFLSIFNILDISHAKGEEKWIKPSIIDHFSYIEPSPEIDRLKALKKHIEMMRQESKKIEWSSLESFYIQYHALFKSFTSNIGSFSNMQQTTIDFYTKHKVDSIFVDERSKVHIVDFDLSGMQSFIYEVTEGGDAKKEIAKTVRGRSFYLSLLSDFIGYAFLNHFELPYEYFIMSAGGKGTIAIPEDANSKTAIKQLQDKIEAMLFANHQGKLSIAFSVRTIIKDQLIGEESYHIIDIDQALSSSKKNKFKSILSTLDQSTITSVQKRCVICNAPVYSNHQHCEVCRSAIELSKALASHEQLSIIFDYAQNERLSNITHIEFGNMGCVHIGQIHDWTYEQKTYPISLNHHQYGDIRYYANVFAKGKSFQEIARTGKGDEKLAILKMDVDNLGLLFLKGLKLKEQSYYKYLTLSRLIDFFFTHELAAICKNKNYHDQVYISYAGGDDLVLICPAIQSLDLLKDIEEAFSSFTCRHPNIHLSAGIEIFHQKSPFRHALKFADGQLEKSKLALGKNRFTVLGHTIKNQELSSIISEIEHYLTCLENDILSKSTIQRLYQAISDSINQPSPVTAFYPYIPLISYMLERNIQKRYEDEKIRLKQLFVTTKIDEDVLVKYFVVFGYVLLGIKNIDRKED